MSEAPTTPPSRRPINLPEGARMPIPGNAEFALYVVVVTFLIVVWIVAASVNTSLFCTFLVVLTVAYFISRGIAKASRVLEQ
jgi:hypothetical protein